MTGSGTVLQPGPDPRLRHALIREGQAAGGEEGGSGSGGSTSYACTPMQPSSALLPTGHSTWPCDTHSADTEEQRWAYTSCAGHNCKRSRTAGQVATGNSIAPSDAPERKPWPYEDVPDARAEEVLQLLEAHKIHAQNMDAAAAMLAEQLGPLCSTLSSRSRMLQAVKGPDQQARAQARLDSTRAVAAQLLQDSAGLLEQMQLLQDAAREPAKQSVSKAKVDEAVALAHAQQQQLRPEILQLQHQLAEANASKQSLAVNVQQQQSAVSASAQRIAQLQTECSVAKAAEQAAAEALQHERVCARAALQRMEARHQHFQQELSSVEAAAKQAAEEAAHTLQSEQKCSRARAQQLADAVDRLQKDVAAAQTAAERVRTERDGARCAAQRLQEARDKQQAAACAEKKASCAAAIAMLKLHGKVQQLQQQLGQQLERQKPCNSVSAAADATAPAPAEASVPAVAADTATGLQGKDPESMEAAQLEVQRQLDDMAKAVQSLQRERSDLRADVDVSCARAQELHQQLDSMHITVQDLQRECGGLQHECDSLQHECGSLRHECGNLNHEARQAAARAAELQQQLDITRAAMKAVQHERDRLMLAAKNSDARVSELEQQLKQSQACEAVAAQALKEQVQSAEAREATKLRQDNNNALAAAVKADAEHLHVDDVRSCNKHLQAGLLFAQFRQHQAERETDSAVQQLAQFQAARQGSAPLWVPKADT